MRKARTLADIKRHPFVESTHTEFDEQIRNTVTLGGKKYAFQLDGTKYDFDKHPTRR